MSGTIDDETARTSGTGAWDERSDDGAAATTGSTRRQTPSVDGAADSGHGATEPADAVDATGTGNGAGTSTTLHPRLGMRALAEFIGTFLLVFGLLALTSWYEIVLQSVVLLPVGVFALYAGLTALFSHVSGAHLNPAVSLAAALLSRIGWLDFVAYVLAQTLGGLAAALAVMATVPTSASTGISQWLLSTVNGYGELSPGASLLQNVSLSFGVTPALIVETVASLIAVGAAIATMGAARQPGRPDAARALAVGAAYAAGFFISWPVTGGSMNPARSTGIAIVAKLRGIGDAGVTDLPVFWIAPLIAAAAIALCAILFDATWHPAPARKAEHAQTDAAQPQDDGASPTPQATGADGTDAAASATGTDTGTVKDAKDTAGEGDD